MNEQMIRQCWDVFKKNNQLTEIRMLDPKKRICSGYFTDVETLLKKIAPYDLSQIWFSLNVINEACYSREQHDEIVIKPKSTTNDNEIVGRDWILIDIDCEKPSDTNSTDEEKELAKPVVNAVYKFLRDEGFNEPVICDSSNGFHLNYKCAMANNDFNTDIIKSFLQVLDILFSTDKIKIDTSTFNASRVCKLYGSISRKGSNTKIRPQRESKILRVPKEIKITQNEYFAKISKMLPEKELPNKSNNYSNDSFDLDGFIKKNDIKIRNVVTTPSYTKYILEECIFDSSHKAPDAALFKLPNGAIGYRCLHNSCANYSWHDVRLKFDPNAYERKEYINPRKFSPYNIREKIEIKEQQKDENKGNIWQTVPEIEDEDRSNIISIPSGILQYDTECCGFDIPSLSVWSGDNGSAKSTLLNQIALNAINKGFKVAMYSGELRNKRLKRWLLYQAAGKNYNIKSQYNDYDYYTPDHIKRKIIEWMGDKFYNYNTRYSHSIQQVCKEVENIVNNKNIDMVILDNLSCLDMDDIEGGTNEQQNTVIRMLLALQDKLEIALHLVVHPRKSEGFLRKDDISGSKTISNLVDNIFMVHRWNLDTQKAAVNFIPSYIYGEINRSGATNLVELIKHREFGEAQGHIYKLFYEPESKRLKNSISEHIRYGWEDQPVQQQIEYVNPMPFEETISEDPPF